MKKYIAFIMCVQFLMSALGLTVVSADDGGSVYASEESFEDLTIAEDGTMMSDTGNATLSFTNDQTNAEKTFVVDNKQLRIDHMTSYDPATSTATFSDAQLVYELPEAISGEVIISMNVWLSSGYTWVAPFDDWLVLKDSSGNEILNIDHADNNLWMMNVREETESYCTVCSRYERLTYLHPSNFVSEMRKLRLGLDFDNGTITFYRNDVLATHGTPEHAYTFRMLNGTRDLQSLTFNFKGGVVATEDLGIFNCKTYIDEIVVRESVEPTWSLNKTDGDIQVDPADGQPIITFNTVQTIAEMKKIKLYKNGELVENPAIKLSEDGRKLTFTEPLAYSTGYKIEIPENVFEEQLMALPTGSVSFRTIHKPYGVTVGETTAYAGSDLIVGNDLSGVPSGEAFTASVSCTGTADKEFIVIVALYKDGAMTDIDLANGKISAEGTATPTISFTLPSDTTGLTYKVFVWENYQTMQIVNP